MCIGERFHRIITVQYPVPFHDVDKFKLIFLYFFQVPILCYSARLFLCYYAVHSTGKERDRVKKKKYENVLNCRKSGFSLIIEFLASICSINKVDLLITISDCSLYPSEEHTNTVHLYSSLI